MSGSNDIIDLITAINISDSQDYKLIFGSENKSAYIGDCSMLGTRMLFVKTILERESGNSGEIFVNMELNSEYPYFREQV